jgi:hypothetical protein
MIHSYACSLVQSEPSRRGVESTFHSHVAHCSTNHCSNYSVEYLPSSRATKVLNEQFARCHTMFCSRVKHCPGTHSLDKIHGLNRSLLGCAQDATTRHIVMLPPVTSRLGRYVFYT